MEFSKVGNFMKSNFQQAIIITKFIKRLVKYFITLLTEMNESRLLPLHIYKRLSGIRKTIRYFYTTFEPLNFVMNPLAVNVHLQQKYIH